VDLGAELEVWRRHHDEVGGIEALELLLRRTYEHLTDEECLTRHLADCENLAREVTISSGNAVDQVEPALGEVGDDLLLDAPIGFLGERHVNGAPGDPVVHVRRVHDETVMGGTPGIGTCRHRKAAGTGEDALLVGERHLDKLGRRAIDDRLLVRMCDSVPCKLLDDHC